MEIREIKAYEVGGRTFESREAAEVHSRRVECAERVGRYLNETLPRDTTSPRERTRVHNTALRYELWRVGLHEKTAADTGEEEA